MEIYNSHLTLKNMLGSNVAIFFDYENIYFNSKTLSRLWTHFSETSSLFKKIKLSFQFAFLSCNTSFQNLD